MDTWSSQEWQESVLQSGEFGSGGDVAEGGDSLVGLVDVVVPVGDAV